MIKSVLRRLSANTPNQKIIHYTVQSPAKSIEVTFFAGTVPYRVKTMKMTFFYRPGLVGLKDLIFFGKNVSSKYFLLKAYQNLDINLPCLLHHIQYNKCGRFYFIYVLVI